MATLAIEHLWFSFFVVLALLFTALLLYFVKVVSHSTKGAIHSKMFLNTDPVIKIFYQFFIVMAFAYILFLIYFVNMELKILFILGELILGLSLIGLSYLIIPMFLRRGR